MVVVITATYVRHDSVENGIDNYSKINDNDDDDDTALGASTTEENDIFLPLKRFFGGNDDKKQGASGTVNDYDDAIAEAKTILNRAVETKKEDPVEVYTALENLEKLMRKKCKAEPETAASEILANLNGSWRLVFTTGTKDTQKKIGAKINYFPIKAVQSFDTTSDPMQIRNGIYLGDFNVIKFFGDFEFDLQKSKLEFDFDKIAVLGFEINLGKGKAAEIGAATGLGSDNNKQLIEKKKKPFFNWISADDNIATARGGGGGLALWKRIDDE
eukprot:CAMPEP_0172510276 /NCGR_PEP_ID=MMETSP1066-20121228/227571_1 /TAXON_ID=671091 /ORGANISM="Coscinodiscus wailesii, Strain CCMP2513" /LENGTH=271 /DNA_ID=CAMNT_0013289173 /DNA_START=125 /DNA_END=941 /DNA_ORIENTATION=+